MLCGIDEAGRGPVMGPLVMAAFFIADERREELASMGLKDSKLLTPKRREHFYELLRTTGDAKFEIIMPFRLNQLMDTQTLNVIELDAAVNILKKYFKGDKNQGSSATVYIDAFGPEEKLKRQFQTALPFRATIIAEHKADLKYPVVSAASILAKVTRDRIISRLKEELGDFGSGYPADPKTITFLRNWLRERSSAPPYVRTHWKTYTKLVQEKSSRKLDEFF